MRNPGVRELRTIELVRSQRYDGNVFIHVIDSSEDPEDDTISEIKGRADRWEHIEPATFSHGSTRNMGVDAATTPLFVSLSSDAHPMNDRWLSALVEPLVDGRADVSYGGQRSPEQDEERDATYGYLYPAEAEIKTKADAPRLGVRAFHFSDVSSAFSTDVIKRVHYPDVSIFQDVGVAKRLLDAGYRIAYVPDGSVYHAHHLGLKGMWHRYRGLGEVWERYGIFDELRSANRGGLMKVGPAAIRAMVPKGGRHPRRLARSVAVGAVKTLAVAQGRRDARNRPPLGLEWDEREGSRAVRRGVESSSTNPGL